MVKLMKTLLKTNRNKREIAKAIVIIANGFHITTRAMPVLVLQVLVFVHDYYYYYFFVGIIVSICTITRTFVVDVSTAIVARVLHIVGVVSLLR